MITKGIKLKGKESQSIDITVEIGPGKIRFVAGPGPQFVQYIRASYAKSVKPDKDPDPSLVQYNRSKNATASIQVKYESNIEKPESDNNKLKTKVVPDKQAGSHIKTGINISNQNSDSHTNLTTSAESSPSEILDLLSQIFFLI